MQTAQNTEAKYVYLLVDVSPEVSDDISALLFEWEALGLEERDGTTLVRSRVLNKVTLVANFADDAAANHAAEQLALLKAEAYPEEQFTPAVEYVIGDAWRDAWKEHFKPFTLCRHGEHAVVIRPPWEPYEAKALETVLELEPGRAFGTGLHETTSLVAQALAERAPISADRVLDLGSGSGILSLVAMHFGAKLVHAVDVDPEATAVALENAERNGLSARMVASTGELASVTGTYPLVLANIEAKVLVPIGGELAARLAPGGTLILSGILGFQEAELLLAYGQLTHLETKHRGEWISLIFQAP
jgi:ribosomal protein L11 methyltransferase